ncbi:MAG: rRNA maturation RNase YbeY [Anaerolineales bacterium]
MIFIDVLKPFQELTGTAVLEAAAEAALQSDQESGPSSLTLHRGDVVICYPQAASQAEKRGHAVEDELQLLVVHGVLHLLGYDHASQEEKDLMWEIQGNILADLGLEIEVSEE